jgi:hypothetical protein
LIRTLLSSWCQTPERTIADDRLCERIGGEDIE